MTGRRLSRSRPRAWGAVVAGLVLVASGCGGDPAPVDDQAETADAERADPEDQGVPEDLTPAEVCALLDDATLAAHLEAEIREAAPGSSRPECQWFYALDSGTVTNLQVQVMSMDQTSERVGVEALEWALGRAPDGSEITEVASIDAPNGSYEFGGSTVHFVVDSAGRVVTVAAHSDSPQAGRVALVNEVLAVLAARHP